MAKYTVELKTLLEIPEYYRGIQKALSTYPLYTKRSKEEYIPSYIPTRAELNTKILNYYKYREIGFESVERFLDELEISMKEIMPKYNLLFNSADQDFNVIYNVDYKRTIDTDKGGNSSSNVKGNDQTFSNMESTSENHAKGEDGSESNATTSGKTREVDSQTPQNEIGIPDDIDGVRYADKAVWGKNESTDYIKKSGSTKTDANGKDTSTNNTRGENEVVSSGEHTETEKTLETTKGNYGVVSAQELISKYRDTIINIEQMIINDERISELFMLVY